MTSFQVRPDTAPMENHIRVICEARDASFAECTDLLETSVFVAYCETPAGNALRMDQDAGVASHLEPRHIGGFICSTRG